MKSFNIKSITIELKIILVLPYPGGNLATDLVLLALLIVMETLRIFFGWKSNLTESMAEMLLSIGLFVLGVLGVLYILIWQVIRKPKSRVVKGHLNNTWHSFYTFWPLPTNRYVTVDIPYFVTFKDFTALDRDMS